MKDMRFMNSIKIDRCLQKHKSFIDRIYAKYGFSQEHYLGYVPLIYLPGLSHKKNVVKNIHYHLHPSMLQQRVIYRNQLLWKAAVLSSTPPIINSFKGQKSIPNQATVPNSVAIFNGDSYQWNSSSYSSFFPKKLIQDAKKILWLTDKRSSYQSVSTKLKYDYQSTNGLRQHLLQLNQSNSINSQFTNPIVSYGKCYQVIEQSHMLIKSKRFIHLFNRPFLPDILTKNSDVFQLNSLFEAYPGQGLNVQENRLSLQGTKSVSIKYAQFRNYQLAKIMAVPGGLIQAGDKRWLEYVVLQNERILSRQFHDIKRYLEMQHLVTDLKSSINNSRIKRTSYKWGQHKLPIVAASTNNIGTIKSLPSYLHSLVLNQQHNIQINSGFSDLYMSDKQGKAMVIGPEPSFMRFNNIYSKNAYSTAKQLTNTIAIMMGSVSNVNTIKSWQDHFTCFAQIRNQLNKYSSTNMVFSITERSGPITKELKQFFTNSESFYLRNSQFAQIIFNINNLLQTRYQNPAIFNQGALKKQGFYILPEQKDIWIKEPSLLFANTNRNYFNNSLRAGRQMAKINSFMSSFPSIVVENGILRKYKYDSHSLLRRLIISINEIKQYLDIFRLYPEFKKIILNTTEEKLTRHREPYKYPIVEKPADRTQYRSFIRHFNNRVLNKKYFDADNSIYQSFDTLKHHQQSSVTGQWPVFTSSANVYFRNSQLAKLFSLNGSLPSKMAENIKFLPTSNYNSSLLRSYINPFNEMKRYLEIFPLYSQFNKIIFNIMNKKLISNQSYKNMIAEKPADGAHYLAVIKNFSSLELHKKYFSSDSSSLQSFFILVHHQESSLKRFWPAFTSMANVYFKNSQLAERQMAKVISLLGSFRPSMAGNKQFVSTNNYNNHSLLHRYIIPINKMQRYLKIFHLYPEFKNILSNTAEKKLTRYQAFKYRIIKKSADESQYLQFIASFNNLVLNRKYFNTDSSSSQSFYTLEHNQVSSVTRQWPAFISRANVYLPKLQLAGKQTAIPATVRISKINDKRVREFKTLTHESNRFFKENNNYLHNKQQYLEITRFYRKLKQLVENSRGAESIHHKELYKLQISPDTRVSVNKISTYNSRFNGLELNRSHFYMNSKTIRQFYHISKAGLSRSLWSEISSKESVREVFLQNIYRIIANTNSTYASSFNDLGLKRNGFNSNAEATSQISHISRASLSRRLRSEIRLKESARGVFFRNIYRIIANSIRPYDSSFNNSELKRSGVNSNAEAARQFYHISRAGLIRGLRSEIRSKESAREVFFQNRYRIIANKNSTYGSSFNDSGAEAIRQTYYISRAGLNRSMLSEIKSKESVRNLFLQRIYNQSIYNRKAEPVDYNTPQTIVANYQNTLASYQKTASTFSYSKHYSKLEYKTAANAVYKQQLENQLNGLILEFKRKKRTSIHEISTNEPANSSILSIQGDTEKASAMLSNEQLDKIVASLYKKLEKKIKFERQRSGIR